MKNRKPVVRFPVLNQRAAGILPAEQNWNRQQDAGSTFTAPLAMRWCRRKPRSCRATPLGAGELIVFRQTIRAAQAAGLDLATICRHGDAT